VYHRRLLHDQPDRSARGAVSERLDAHVLQFPKGRAPEFVAFPVHRAESEVESGSGGGAEAVSGPRAVLAEPGAGPEADVPKSGRVLRVRYCSACGTWYGAYYPQATVAEDDAKRYTCQHCCRPCEFLDHWPNRHGECRALAVPSGFGLDAERGVDVCAGSRYREALGPAQQELAL
jgi:hypothetical protein